jgi:hypothetical protein
MGKLGMKISRAFHKVGQKMQTATTKIGDKTNHVIKETRGVVKVLGDKAVQLGNQTKNAINQIPDINRKAINLGNRIIDKSGNVTNILRKASGTISSLTNGLAEIGGNVPVVGSFLKAGAKSSELLAKGAKRLDNVRDKADHKLDKYADVSRSTIADIEKINSRKKVAIQEAQNENNDDSNNFI